MVPLQVLLKWSEDGEWAIIRRGPTGVGYVLEAYRSDDTAKSTLPYCSFPLEQSEIADLFARQGKQWRSE